MMDVRSETYVATFSTDHVERLIAGNVCVHCGKTIADKDAEYCPYCGNERTSIQKDNIKMLRDKYRHAPIRTCPRCGERLKCDVRVYFDCMENISDPDEWDYAFYNFHFGEPKCEKCEKEFKEKRDQLKRKQALESKQFEKSFWNGLK